MKIIKKGNKKEEKENKFYKVKCDNCDTEFICEDGDFQVIAERCIDGRHIKYIHCPVCGTDIYPIKNLEEISEEEYNELLND